MKLFTPFSLGALELPNRVVMAPMTRSRAIGGLPNELMRDYYAARADAGLLITEGIAPAPSGLGYSRIPGLFNDEQVVGFRKITAAVHDLGGRIVAQLMHVGRIAHPLNVPQGAPIVAPSAVRAAGTMWTDQEGLQPFPEPQALSVSGIREARDAFVSAARRAREAGFDGVELHGANGYLLSQFLHPHTNRRLDEYGGDAENRARFVLDVVAATAEAIGPERVGLRLSPFGTFNDLPEAEGVLEQYRIVAEGVRGIAFIHVVNNPNPEFVATAQAIREAFRGPLIRNGGYDRLSAEAALEGGEADLISFGRHFLANPDYVERLRRGAPLNAPEPSTFYTPGAKGYLDYPRLEGAGV